MNLGFLVVHFKEWWEGLHVTEGPFQMVGVGRVGKVPIEVPIATHATRNLSGSLNTAGKSAFDIWWDYVCEFRDLAEESVSSAEDDVLQWKLPQADWFLYLLSNVIGLMSNCGSLVTASAAFAKYQTDLKLALNLFGFPATAANVQASIDLDRDYEEHGEWTPGFEQRSNQIENNCDWSYAQLVDYLRCHDEDFGHSILPYCG